MRPSAVTNHPFATDSEQALVERAKAAPEAFGELYERYVDKIYSYIYYRVSNSSDAEDLTARTFYQALAKIESYEHRGLPFSAWLYRIAHNLVANWHRQHSRRKFVSLEDVELPSFHRDNPSLTVEIQETHSELLAAIHRLTADRQQLLLLKYVERFSNAEIGQVMGRSESSIKSLYHRTLQSLRKDFADRDHS